MEKKVTVMVLKVDLECACCYKKVKRLCCMIPQIRDQKYDEKNNLVTITVVCCSPEKIRDKLCYNGGKTIKSIEIKEPLKPKPPENPGTTKNGSKKPVEPPAPPPSKPPEPKAIPVQGYLPVYLVPVCCARCSHGQPGGPCHHGGGGGVRDCCTQCFHGQPGGPCHHGGGGVPVCCSECFHGQPGGPCYHGGGGGYGMPPPRPGCDPYAYGGAAYRTGCYGPSRCDYFSEENPQGCSIM